MFVDTLALGNQSGSAGGTAAIGVRRDKAALFQWVKAPPGKCSSRKLPEQLWR
jgi:hypothetical protein